MENIFCFKLLLKHAKSFLVFNLLINLLMTVCDVETEIFMSVEYAGCPIMDKRFLNFSKWRELLPGKRLSKQKFLYYAFLYFFQLSPKDDTALSQNNNLKITKRKPFFFSFAGLQRFKMNCKNEVNANTLLNVHLSI